MTDLTPEELMDQLADIIRPITPTYWDGWAEIRRRLEELDRLKGDAKFVANEVTQECRKLKERLDTAKAELQKLKDQMAWDAEGRRLTEERLEKCEAALRKARTLLISEGDPDEDGEMIAEIDELLGNAARAALEG